MVMDIAVIGLVVAFVVMVAVLVGLWVGWRMGWVEGYEGGSWARETSCCCDLDCSGVLALWGDEATR